MLINLRKIAECIADEVLPIERRIEEIESARWLALEVLYDNGLIDEYKRRRRKQIIAAMLLEADSVTPVDYRGQGRGGAGDEKI